MAPAPLMRFESFAILIAFAVIYILVGERVVVDQGVVDFDALDRLSRALMVTHDDPPKLASIGFQTPPGQTLVLVPFALVGKLASSALALPLSGALLAAGALTFVNRTFAAVGMDRWPRLAVVVGVAANPMFAYYAVNGTGDAAYLLGAAAGLFCLIGWTRSGSPRYLLGAGPAIALAALSGYEFVLWSLVIAFVIATTLRSEHRPGAEVEGSTLAFATPIAYGFGLWIIFNAIAGGDPFGWLTTGDAAPAINAVAGEGGGFDLSQGIVDALRIQLIFPAALLSVPLLVADGVRSGARLSYGLALLVVGNVAYSLAGAAIEGSASAIELRDALPGMLAGLAGLAWLYGGGAGGRRPAAGWAIVAIVAVALPAAWTQMESYPHQNLEGAFTRALSSGDDQEGTESPGGLPVGVDQERSIAELVDALPIADGKILTDEDRTYGVIALSGRPELFYDRIGEGEGEFRSALAQPAGTVDFLLAERSEEDPILDRYPGADEGAVPFLDPVATNDRYALLQIVDPADQPGEAAPAGAPAGADRGAAPEPGSGAGPTLGTAPRPAPVGKGPARGGKRSGKGRAGAPRR